MRTRAGLPFANANPDGARPLRSAGRPPPLLADTTYRDGAGAERPQIIHTTARNGAPPHVYRQYDSYTAHCSYFSTSEDRLLRGSIRDQPYRQIWGKTRKYLAIIWIRPANGAAQGARKLPRTPGPCLRADFGVPHEWGRVSRIILRRARRWESPKRAPNRHRLAAPYRAAVSSSIFLLHMPPRRRLSQRLGAAGYMRWRVFGRGKVIPLRIPGGITSLVQPCDTVFNQPFKAYVRKEHEMKEFARR